MCGVVRPVASPSASHLPIPPDSADTAGATDAADSTDTAYSTDAANSTDSANSTDAANSTNTADSTDAANRLPPFVLRLKLLLWLI